MAAYSSKASSLYDWHLRLGHASADTIKKAYRTAIYKVHPDRVATGTAAEQQAAARKAQELNAAYQVMKIYRRFN